MRGLALFLAAAGSVEAVATKSDSIKGVITLLEGILKNAEAESKKTAEIYDKTACSCRDNLRDMSRQFEETQKEIDRQTTISRDFKAKSDALFTKIQKHVGVKSDMEALVAQKYEDIKASAGSAEKTVNFLEETDSALQAEISELGTINQPYLDGLIQADTQTLSVERAKCEERVRKIDEMIAACDKVLKVLEGGQSKKIIEMVKSLKQQAFDKKTKIQQGENECQATIYSLEKAISSNSNFLDLSKTASAATEAEKAEADAGLAKANEEIATNTAARDQLKEDVKKTNSECEQAATDYDEHSSLLSAEIAGLNGAIKALKKVPGKDDSSSFIQLMTEANPLIAKADQSITLLAQRATLMHSSRLATMALQLRYGNKAGGPDFFESVRSMIVTMVERLEDEQMAETSKTDWCASSLAELKGSKKAAQVAYEQAVTNVRTSEAIIAEKTSEKKETEDEKTEAEKVKKEMEDLLKEKDEFYTAQEDEKTKGTDALIEAISFLEEIYAGAGADARASGPSGGVKTRATNGGGVIDMIVGIKDDYAWDADVANMEMQCDANDSYKPRGSSEGVSCDDGVGRKGPTTDPPTPPRASETHELKKNIAAKGLEIDGLETKISLLATAIKEEKVTLNEAEKDKDATNGVLDSSKAALKARQEACVNAEDSFEARQKRREEEIAALKEALSILEEHSKNSETGAPESFLAINKKSHA